MNLMSERLKRERTKTTNALKAGLVAAQLLNPLAHSKLEAAEIPPNATWEQGVTELRRSVMQEPVEDDATSLTFRDGKHRWMKTGAGEATIVRSNYRIMVSDLSVLVGKEPIANLCDAHTHAVASIATAFKIPLSDSKRAYAPPGYGDTFVVSRGGRSDEIPEIALKAGIQIDTITATVFDPRGIWYYRTLSDNERKNHPHQRRYSEIVEDFASFHYNFVHASERPDFDFQKEYEQLQQAYRQLIWTEVRFVPYEEVAKEPA